MILEGLSDESVEAVEAVEAVEPVEAVAVVDGRAAEQAGRRSRVEKDVRKVVAGTIKTLPRSSQS